MSRRRSLGDMGSVPAGGVVAGRIACATNERPRRERDVTRRKPFLTALLATTVLAGMSLTAVAEDLVTNDHVGKADAPNVLTVRANPDQSPNSPFPEQKAAFKPIWQAWADKHPDWQIKFEFFTNDIGGEHARLLE